MSKFTPWFDGKKHKPARKGVYQRKSYAGKYSYWDGKNWCRGFGSFFQSEQSKYAASYDQDAQWRGLAKNPNA